MAIKSFVNNHHICCVDRANSLAFYKENGEKKRQILNEKFWTKFKANSAGLHFSSKHLLKKNP